MRINYVNLAGEKHPICFSLSAIIEIGEVFGGIEEMQKMIDSADVLKQAKAVDSLLTILLKAGRKYCELEGCALPTKLEGRPADYIDITDADIMSTIFSAMKSDMKQDVVAVGKNTAPAQSEA